MKAEELRIGNYIRGIHQEDENDGIFQVEQIRTFGDGGTRLGVQYREGSCCALLDEQNEEGLEPIPLSPEWLIRFGAIFPYDDKLRLELAGLSFYYSPTGLLYLNDSGYNEAISKAVEFVHQLQNLIFSLTGEELTLKN